MDILEGMQTAKPEGLASGFKDWLKMWLVNLSCTLSAFELTSVMSIAKFGVCLEKLSVSNHVQH